MRCVRVYQFTISPDHGLVSVVARTNRCRFFPSCSAYALKAIRQYGLLKGIMASVCRVARCNPWHSGGYDPLRD